MTYAVADERARYLDMSAFAENRLDPDERERVAEWLQKHPDALGDIAAARALASGVPYAPLPETSLARARAIVGGDSEPSRYGRRVSTQRG